MNAWSLINLLVFIQIVTCRDFYLGMFRRNDFLVAQDVIYKAPAPFGYTTASYGRLFKCPITYFRVVDRLGMGRGPITTIVRGGLRKKFINVRIKSTYRLPISVNIYVGCENKKPSTFRTTLSKTTKLASTRSTTTAATKKTATTAGKDKTERKVVVTTEKANSSKSSSSATTSTSTTKKSTEPGTNIEVTTPGGTTPGGTTTTIPKGTTTTLSTTSTTTTTTTTTEKPV